MTPTLIVLGLLALGVAIIVFATRRRGPGAARPAVDPKTGWDAPFTPADAPVVETEDAQPALDTEPGEPATTETLRS